MCMYTFPKDIYVTGSENACLLPTNTPLISPNDQDLCKIWLEENKISLFLSDSKSQ